MKKLIEWILSLLKKMLGIKSPSLELKKGWNNITSDGQLVNEDWKD